MLATPMPGCQAFQFELRMQRPDLGLGQPADSLQMLLSPVVIFVIASEAKPASQAWN